MLLVHPPPPHTHTPHTPTHILAFYTHHLVCAAVKVAPTVVHGLVVLLLHLCTGTVHADASARCTVRHALCAVPEWLLEARAKHLLQALGWPNIPSSKAFALARTGSRHCGGSAGQAWDAFEAETIAARRGELNAASQEADADHELLHHQASGGGGGGGGGRGCAREDVGHPQLLRQH